MSKQQIEADSLLRGHWSDVASHDVCYISSARQSIPTKQEQFSVWIEAERLHQIGQACVLQLREQHGMTHEFPKRSEVYFSRLSDWTGTNTAEDSARAAGKTYFAYSQAGYSGVRHVGDMGRNIICAVIDLIDDRPKG